MAKTAAERAKAYRQKKHIEKLGMRHEKVCRDQKRDAVTEKRDENVTEQERDAPGAIVTKVTAVGTAEGGVIGGQCFGRKPTFDDLPSHIQRQIEKYAGNSLCPNRNEMVRRAIEHYCGVVA